MSVFEVIENRKSVRSYLDEEVNEEELKKIVETGKKAPQAGEFQITVIQNKNLIAKINDLALTGMKNSGNDFLVERASIEGYQPLYNAPVLVLLSAPEEGHGDINTALASENIILAATELGYGTVYLVTPTLAFLGEEREGLLKELNLPNGFIPVNGIAIGKEGVETIQSPPAEDIDNINYVK
ncbi:nitroreductase family protein [Methanobrevibacter curvatus]|uniref:FMN reductase n=1 Tax=Methanobrevibacter curvatus TaxID=49547 RepID=A0A166CIK0_9EURY|nr:nitroreductase family protein [Methanobrevibacter curvatus]KZX14545.1 FMN reductase [Methanobrevibacter curvatus]